MAMIPSCRHSVAGTRISGARFVPRHVGAPLNIPLVQASLTLASYRVCPEPGGPIFEWDPSLQRAFARLKN